MLLSESLTWSVGPWTLLVSSLQMSISWLDINSLLHPLHGRQISECEGAPSYQIVRCRLADLAAISLGFCDFAIFCPRHCACPQGQCAENGYLQLSQILSCVFLLLPSQSSRHTVPCSSVLCAPGLLSVSVFLHRPCFPYLSSAPLSPLFCLRLP